RQEDSRKQRGERSLQALLTSLGKGCKRYIVIKDDCAAAASVRGKRCKRYIAVGDGHARTCGAASAAAAGAAAASAATATAVSAASAVAARILAAASYRAKVHDKRGILRKRCITQLVHG